MVVNGGSRARAYVRKARAELSALAEEGVRATGNAFSPLLFAKGRPNEVERAGKEPLSGADGKALRAAALALGYAPEHWAALALWGADGTALDGARARRAVAVLDPATLVACDDQAALVLEDALGCEPLVPGQVTEVLGMRVLALGGFEDALADQRAKQVMWARLKLVPPLGAPY